MGKIRRRIMMENMNRQQAENFIRELYSAGKINTVTGYELLIWMENNL